MLTAAAGLLHPGGHVALLLEPSIPRACTITWTGAVQAACHNAGLDYLQDAICLHSDPDDGPGDRDGGDSRRHPQHRMVLTLRAQAGAHA